MKLSFIILCSVFVVVARTQSLDEIEKSFNSLKDSNKLFSSEIFPLAIKIKEALENKDTSASLFNRFKELKKSLPLGVRVIVWNESTHIFNKYFSKEYLYPVYDGSAYDESRRPVFTWVPGGRDATGQWEFSTKNNGETFVIKNLHYKEYIYAAANSYAYDSSRRTVFTWRPGTSDDCEWYVEIVSDDEIMLKDKTYGEYFYAGADGLKRNNDRRNVFTWRPKDSCDSTCVWRLSPDGEGTKTFNLVRVLLKFYFIFLVPALTPEEEKILDDYKVSKSFKFLQKFIKKLKIRAKHC